MAAEQLLSVITFFRRVVLQGATEKTTDVDFQWTDQRSDETDDDQGRFGGNRRTDDNHIGETPDSTCPTRTRSHERDSYKYSEQ